MDFSKVNPTVVFVGFLALIVVSGVGEYFHVVPSGSADVLIGALTGGGIYHIASTQGSSIALAAPPTTPTTGGITNGNVSK